MTIRIGEEITIDGKPATFDQAVAAIEMLRKIAVFDRAEKARSRSCDGWVPDEFPFAEIANYFDRAAKQFVAEARQKPSELTAANGVDQQVETHDG